MSRLMSAPPPVELGSLLLDRVDGLYVIVRADVRVQIADAVVEAAREHPDDMLRCDGQTLTLTAANGAVSYLLEAHSPEGWWEARRTHVEGEVAAMAALWTLGADGEQVDP